MIKRSLEFLRNKWILQPFLLAIYIVLVNVEDFGVSYIKWNEIGFTFMLVLLYWMFIYFLFSRLIVSDKRRASSIVTFIVFTSILFEYIHHTLFFISLLQSRHTFLIIVIIFIVVLVRAIKATRKTLLFPKKIIAFLNITFIILSLFTMSKIFLAAGTKKTTPSLFTSEKCNNIYLIVPDGYANITSLEKYWNYDDSPFLKQISNLGFYYAKNSRSNYCFTMQTVASMLNLEYLEKNEIRSDGILLHKIRENKTIELLKNKDYQVCNFSVGEINDTSNKYDADGFTNISNFFPFIYSKTIYNYIGIFINNKKRGSLNNISKNIQREINIKKEITSIIHNNDIKPKFVYYHSMLTHPPFYLDGNGNISEDIAIKNPSQEELGIWLGNKKGFNTLGNTKDDSLWMKDYLNALKFTNNRVLDLINDIMIKSNHKSIIVVMSDHGFRHILNYSIKDVESEKYSNFCAIYYPDKDYKNLYDSITPINVMRAVLNKAVSTQFKRLPDVSGLSTQ